MAIDARTKAILKHAGLNRDISPAKEFKAPPPTPSPRTSIQSLVAERPFARVELVILRKYPRRYVSNQRFTGYVAAACGRDETGFVGLVLWGEQVEEVRVGDLVRIEAGWTRRHAGDLIISSGRNGRLSVIEG
ncbi:MAG: hypothetical protein ACKVHH_07125 [Candidatus Poseidoniales archaeon]|jgi:hypothetical protein